MPGRAQVRLVMPVGGSYSIKDPTPEALTEMQQLASLSKRSLQAEELPALTFDRVNPKDTDYIFPLFRALSADLIAGYFLDFREKGVLEAAAPLLQGQTVYTNHRFWDVERWIGVVNLAEWDAKGERTSGIPGINTELKIDWVVAPRIARGLLMKPPAIHSVSATVIFEWQASHPDLLEKRIFWQNLGEEIDGEIVRIIVTKILEFWELSLVFQGADRWAKQMPGDDEYDDEELIARSHQRLAKPPNSISTKEKTTVKLTNQRKQALGITQEGEDFSDEIVLSAVDSLTTRIASANAIIEASRANVLRLATLVEGNEQGQLPDVIQKMIAGADPAQLPGLETLYAEKAEKKVTKTCQQCGSTDIQNRSSVENPETVSAEQSATRVLDTSRIF